LCHQKFNDHTQLAQHYADTHAEESIAEKKDGNITQPKEIQVVKFSIEVFIRLFNLAKSSGRNCPMETTIYRIGRKSNFM
jgi:hypothetical protein